MTGIACALGSLGDVPALLIWGPRDPVLNDVYLRDLRRRLPHADVHRFETAGHLLAEDADVAGAVLAWLADLARRGTGRELPPPPGPDRDAAVVFTSGSTGPAKGVVYTYRQIEAARDVLLAAYPIGPGDRLVAAFAPFALFGPGLGGTTVVPDCDVTAPATLTATALAGSVLAADATAVFARKGSAAMKRQKMTQIAAALVVVAAGTAIAGAVTAHAGPQARGRPDPAAQAAAAPHTLAHGAAARVPTCPAATICAFNGPDATGAEFTFPTSANHSQWISFHQVSQASGSTFHPSSIINNSGTDVWVFDWGAGLVGGPYCALGTSLRPYTFTDWQPVNGGKTPPPSPPATPYTPVTYQPGWFFVNFNVNTCAAVPTPTPTAVAP